MTPAIQLVFVPVPMASGGVGWERKAKPSPPPFAPRPGPWPLKAQPLPVREVRALVEAGKKLIVERRPS